MVRLTDMDMNNNIDNIFWNISTRKPPRHVQNDRSYAAISGRQYHLYHLLALILCPDI